MRMFSEINTGTGRVRKVDILFSVGGWNQLTDAWIKQKAEEGGEMCTQSSFPVSLLELDHLSCCKCDSHHQLLWLRPLTFE